LENILIMTKQDDFDNAIQVNNYKVVKTLLNDPEVDPTNNVNFAIRISSEHGFIDIVKLLLNDPRVDPTDDFNDAIRYASRSGETETVRLLLTDSRVNPTSVNNSAISNAELNGYIETVALLWIDKRFKNTLKIDNLPLYNQLQKEDIQDKINNF
jgi:hypothetical protein